MENRSRHERWHKHGVKQHSRVELRGYVESSANSIHRSFPQPKIGPGDANRVYQIETGDGKEEAGNFGTPYLQSRGRTSLLIRYQANAEEQQCLESSSCELSSFPLCVLLEISPLDCCRLLSRGRNMGEVRCRYFFWKWRSRQRANSWGIFLRCRASQAFPAAQRRCRKDLKIASAPFVICLCATLARIRRVGSRSWVGELGLVKMFPGVGTQQRAIAASSVRLR
jgi:hypothetical protein